MQKIRLLSIPLFLGIAVYFLFFFQPVEKSVYMTDTGEIFSTSYKITYCSSKKEDVQLIVKQSINDINNALSTFNPNSIISKVNQNIPTQTDTFFDEVFIRAMAVSKISNGSFDMTVAPLVNFWGFGFEEHGEVTDSAVQALLPLVGYQTVRLENSRVIKDNAATMLDASAIAKGFACDLIARQFDALGIEHYLIEIGGEIVAKGDNAQGKPWRIGINKPVDNSLLANEVERVVLLSEGGMATSGNYRNYREQSGKRIGHIIDPRTGYPSESNIISATIIASDCMTADAYATACLVMGLEEALALCKALPDIEGFFIYDNNGTQAIAYSDGFERYLE